MYVFAMNDKASPPSSNTSKKCKDLFPYFSSLESRLAGEHTVVWWTSPDYMAQQPVLRPENSLPNARSNVALYERILIKFDMRVNHT
jgi:hypothetical protein